ncbi:MAG: 50S ribosomal protein L23, partial [Proteobacteria bacterium]
MYEIIKKPLISEKNAGHAEDSNTYAFEVDLKAD